jgi:hypothetical protein
MLARYERMFASWHRLHSAFAPSMSSARAFAAPAADIAAQLRMPEGARPPIVSNARAIFSASPEATAPPATPFIQRCMGQSGLPLDPHS